MPTRGAIYMVWGNETKLRKALQRSIDSLKVTNPSLPYTVIELENKGAWEGLLQKAGMLERTPYEETVFLDADTLVLGPLDFGFQKAIQHGLACCICEAPWLKRYSPNYGDLIEYNTGVLFFTRKAERIFAAWKDLISRVSSQILLINDKGDLIKMPYNDQASFSLAIEQTAASPFILPMNWNYRPPWHYGFVGPIRVWHSYDEPPANIITTSNFYNNAKNPVFQYHVPDTPPLKPPVPKLDGQKGVTPTKKV
jgi:hypothetical protein